MKFTVTLDLERTQGPRSDPSLVAEMVEEEMPDEIWLEDTCYQVTVASVERVVRGTL